eukprot:m.341346 g.341346  ORF g.341346 m.341346 type:complete len:2823 (+) comp16112_c1_seq2:204-8672(+)
MGWLALLLLYLGLPALILFILFRNSLLEVFLVAVFPRILPAGHAVEHGNINLRWNSISLSHYTIQTPLATIEVPRISVSLSKWQLQCQIPSLNVALKKPASMQSTQPPEAPHTALAQSRSASAHSTSASATPTPTHKALPFPVRFLFKLFRFEACVGSIFCSNHLAIEQAATGPNAVRVKPYAVSLSVDGFALRIGATCDGDGAEEQPVDQQTEGKGEDSEAEKEDLRGAHAHAGTGRRSSWSTPHNTESDSDGDGESIRLLRIQVSLDRVEVCSTLASLQPNHVPRVNERTLAFVIEAMSLRVITPQMALGGPQTKVMFGIDGLLLGEALSLPKGMLNPAAFVKTKVPATHRHFVVRPSHADMGPTGQQRSTYAPVNSFVLASRARPRRHLSTPPNSFSLSTSTSSSASTPASSVRESISGATVFDNADKKQSAAAYHRLGSDLDTYYERIFQLTSLNIDMRVASPPRIEQYKHHQKDGATLAPFATTRSVAVDLGAIESFWSVDTHLCIAQTLVSVCHQLGVPNLSNADERRDQAQHGVGEADQQEIQRRADSNEPQSTVTVKVKDVSSPVPPTPTRHSPKPIRVSPTNQPSKQRVTGTSPTHGTPSVFAPIGPQPIGTSSPSSMHERSFPRPRSPRVTSPRSHRKMPNAPPSSRAATPAASRAMSPTPRRRLPATPGQAQTKDTSLNATQANSSTAAAGNSSGSYPKAGTSTVQPPTVFLSVSISLKKVELWMLMSPRTVMMVRFDEVNALAQPFGYLVRPICHKQQCVRRESGAGKGSDKRSRLRHNPRSKLSTTSLFSSEVHQPHPRPDGFATLTLGAFVVQFNGDNLVNATRLSCHWRGGGSIRHTPFFGAEKAVQLQTGKVFQTAGSPHAVVEIEHVLCTAPSNTFTGQYFDDSKHAVNLVRRAQRTHFSELMLVLRGRKSSQGTAPKTRDMPFTELLGDASTLLPTYTPKAPNTGITTAESETLRHALEQQAKLEESGNIGRSLGAQGSTRQLPPPIALAIGKFEIVFEEDPFEQKLEVIAAVGRRDAAERLNRETILEERIRSMESEGTTLKPSSKRILRNTLAAKSGSLYAQQIQEAMEKNHRPLLHVVYTSLSLVLFPHETLATRPTLETRIREIDSKSHYPDQGIGYDIMIGREICLRFQSLNIQVRKLPKPLMHVSDLSLCGTMILAEPLAPLKAKYTELVYVHPRCGAVLGKGITPIKFYHDLHTVSRDVCIAIGPYLDPVATQFANIADDLTTPSCDPSPLLPWFDKARLIRHGPFHFKSDTVTVCGLINPAIYKDTNYLKLEFRQPDFTWNHSHLTLDADLDAIIVTPTKFNNCPLFSFPGLTLTMIFHWMTTGQGNNHHAVTATSPPHVAGPGHDSFAPFRTRRLEVDMTWAVGDASDQECDLDESSGRSDLRSTFTSLRDDRRERRSGIADLIHSLRESMIAEVDTEDGEEDDEEDEELAALFAGDDSDTVSQDAWSNGPRSPLVFGVDDDEEDDDEDDDNTDAIPLGSLQREPVACVLFYAGTLKWLEQMQRAGAEVMRPICKGSHFMAGFQRSCRPVCTDDYLAWYYPLYCHRTVTTLFADNHSQKAVQHLGFDLSQASTSDTHHPDTPRPLLRPLKKKPTFGDVMSEIRTQYTTPVLSLIYCNQYERRDCLFATSIDVDIKLLFNNVVVDPLPTQFTPTAPHPVSTVRSPPPQPGAKPPRSRQLSSSEPSLDAWDDPLSQPQMMPLKRKFCRDWSLSTGEGYMDDLDMYIVCCASPLSETDSLLTNILIDNLRAATRRHHLYSERVQQWEADPTACDEGNLLGGDHWHHLLYCTRWIFSAYPPVERHRTRPGTSMSVSSPNARVRTHSTASEDATADTEEADSTVRFPEGGKAGGAMAAMAAAAAAATQRSRSPLSDSISVATLTRTESGSSLSRRISLDASPTTPDARMSSPITFDMQGSISPMLPKKRAGVAGATDVQSQNSIPSVVSAQSGQSATSVTTLTSVQQEVPLHSTCGKPTIRVLPQLIPNRMGDVYAFTCVMTDARLVWSKAIKEATDSISFTYRNRHKLDNLLNHNVFLTPTELARKHFHWLRDDQQVPGNSDSNDGSNVSLLDKLLLSPNFTRTTFDTPQGSSKRGHSRKRSMLAGNEFDITVEETDDPHSSSSASLRPRIDPQDIRRRFFFVRMEDFQACFRGTTTSLPVVLVADAVEMEEIDHKYVPRLGRIDSKLSQIRAAHNAQYFTVDSTRPVVWLPPSLIQKPGYEVDGPGICRVIHPCSFSVSKIIFQHDLLVLQRAKREDIAEIPATAPAAQQLFDAREEEYNSVATRFTTFQMETNAEQWSALLDIMQNVVFADDVEEESNQEHKRLLQFREQLNDLSLQTRRAEILDIQKAIKTLTVKLRVLEEKISVLCTRSAHSDRDLERMKSLQELWSAARDQLRTALDELPLHVQLLRETYLNTAGSSYSDDLDHMCISSICIDDWIWRLCMFEDEVDLPLSQRASRVSSASLNSLPTMLQHARSTSHLSLPTDSDDATAATEQSAIPIAEFQIQKLRFVKDVHTNGAGEQQLSVQDIIAYNKLKNQKYSLILGRYSGVSPSDLFDPNLMMRFYSRMAPPVGGIRVQQHVEFNCVPIFAQLTAELAEHLERFFFSSRDDEETGASAEKAVSPARTPVLLRKASALPQLPATETQVVQDVEEMKNRASNNTTFLYVKIPRIQICLSYKSDKSISDLHNFVLTLPMFEYHNETCTSGDLITMFKKDATLNVISQAISHKIGLSSGPAKDEDAASAISSASHKSTATGSDEVRRQQLLGRHAGQQSSSGSGRRGLIRGLFKRRKSPST